MHANQIFAFIRPAISAPSDCSEHLIVSFTHKANGVIKEETARARTNHDESRNSDQCAVQHHSSHRRRSDNRHFSCSSCTAVALMFIKRCIIWHCNMAADNDGCGKRNTILRCNCRYITSAHAIVHSPPFTFHPGN